MDEAAWARWKDLAVPGKRDPTARHLHLTSPERIALEAVLTRPWMLEQERIPPSAVEEAIVSIFSQGPDLRVPAPSAGPRSPT